jgi:hypothetical protein
MPKKVISVPTGGDDVMWPIFRRLGWRPKPPRDVSGTDLVGCYAEGGYWWKFLFWKFYWRCDVDPTWYTLDVLEIVAETEGAFLLTFEDEKGEELSDWFPKSMIDEPNRYKKGDKNVGIAVKRFIAVQKGIVDE